MSERLIFNCTHGKEDPERATLPFVAANIAATAGQDAVVLCGACTKPRGIGEEQLRKGSTIVGAAKVVQEVVVGARTVAVA